MKLLLHYLSRYRWQVILALVLAAINQSFSLMDPYFFGKLIDRFAKTPKNYIENENYIKTIKNYDENNFV